MAENLKKAVANITVKVKITHIVLVRRNGGTILTESPEDARCIVQQLLAEARGIA